MRHVRWPLLSAALLLSISLPALSQATATRPGDFTAKELYEEALAFDRAELVEAYKGGSFRSPKWDAAAIAALDLFAQSCALTQINREVNFPFSPGPKITNEQVIEATQKAMDAGCNDPLVQYAKGVSHRDLQQYDEARALINKAAATIKESRYPAYRRYKVLKRAMEFALTDEQRMAYWAEVQSATVEVAKGPFTNSAARREYAYELVDVYARLPRMVFEDNIGNAADKDVDPWIRSYVESSLETRLAWDARGSGTAGTVTETGWADFKSHLEKAAVAATDAWQAHPELPEPAVNMITICMGLSNGQEAVWFDRALKAQADHRSAFSTMIYANTPRWGGSNAKVLAIGKAAAATARFDTAIPWQYILAAAEVKRDDTGGDPDIYKSSDFQKTADAVFRGYAARFHGKPQEVYFKSMLASAKVAADDLRGARNAFDAIAGEPDPAAFAYFSQWPKYTVEKTYFDTYPNLDGVKKVKDAANRANYKNAIAAIDTLLDKDTPKGRDAQLFAAYREALVMMEGYRTGKALDFTSGETFPFWGADRLDKYHDGALVNSANDGPIDNSSRFNLPDRHFELHLAFEYPDMTTNDTNGIRLVWGRGNAGRNWTVILARNPSAAYLLAPGVEDPKSFPIEDVPKHRVDIVYWGGIPKVTIDGKEADYSFADAKTVRGLSKINSLQFRVAGPVKITDFTLKHLNEKPAGAKLDEDLP